MRVLKDVWIKILSGNPELSVQDINRMCSVNKTFQQLCASGNIWDKIFIRQFGEEVFQQEQQREYLSENVKAFLKVKTFLKDAAVVNNFKLLRLLTFRVFKKGFTLGTDIKGALYDQKWSFKKDVFFGTILSIRMNEFGYSIVFTGDREAKRTTNAAVAANLITETEAKYICYSLDTYYASKIVNIDAINSITTNLLQFIYLLLANKYTLDTNIMKENIYVGQECVVCADIAEYACSRCESRFFCSDNCAKKDWMDSHMFSCI